MADERIGAWVTTTGCFFRAWAPHADAVRVLIQDGPYWENGDEIAAQVLQRHGDYWSGTVPGIPAWKLYRFEITNGAQVFQTTDPAARDVLSSDLTRQDPTKRNASIIVDDDLVNWAAFTTPRFENFIIYQLHVGSFAGRNDQLASGWATFEDIESKLGYIRDLGFDCIQLLPIHEFAIVGLQPGLILRAGIVVWLTVPAGASGRYRT